MRRMTILALSAVFGLGACGEAELDEVPETAEVESDDDMGDLELDEETVLGMDDIGEDIMATGWVSGAPLPMGFFLRTEDDRVIFVQSDADVTAGDQVRVAGPLVATEAAVFEGWETDAFETGFEAEWDVEAIAYVDAFTVTPMSGAMQPAGDTTSMEQDTMGGDAMEPDTAGEGSGTETGVGDPGSKSS